MKPVHSDLLTFVPVCQAHSEVDQRRSGPRTTAFAILPPVEVNTHDTALTLAMNLSL